MEKVFLELLNVSITASWVTLAVLVLRLFLKKAPKWLSCVLWGLVGLRLVLPFSFESSLSLISSTQTLPGNIVENPQLNSGIAAVDKAVNPVIIQQLEPLGPAPLQTALTVCAIAWLVGMGLMVLYGIFTSARLYRSVRTAMPVAGNIYCGDDIDTPFILGVFMPRIFLPSGLDPAQTQALLPIRP